MRAMNVTVDMDDRVAGVISIARSLQGGLTLSVSDVERGTTATISVPSAEHARSLADAIAQAVSQMMEVGR